MDYISIQAGMIPVIDPSTIEEGDKLYYELGRYVGEECIESNWIHTGKFKEIKNVLEFKATLITELQNQGNERFLRYCRHHNFQVIKHE